jgi:hypothetical protein
MLCLCGLAKADDLTSGDLSFTNVWALCVGCLSPTSASFVYDNTTAEFLNVTANWDGLNIVNSNISDPTALSELLNGSLSWEGVVCLNVPPGGCSGEAFFVFLDSPGESVLASPFFTDLTTVTPEPPNAGGFGPVIATDVMTTPEPSSLLLLGIGGLLVTALRLAK